MNYHRVLWEQKLMIFFDMNKGTQSYNDDYGNGNKRSQLYNRNQLYNIRNCWPLTLYGDNTLNVI